MGNGRALRFAELKIRRISQAIETARKYSKCSKETVQEFETILEQWKKLASNLRQN